MYNIIPYKLKSTNVEDDIINLSPVRQKIDSYHREENICGDDYIMVLIDNEHLGETTISGNTDLRGNMIMEIRDSVLSSIHIGLHTGNTK